MMKIKWLIGFNSAFMGVMDPNQRIKASQCLVDVEPIIKELSSKDDNRAFRSKTSQTPNRSRISEAGGVCFVGCCRISVCGMVNEGFVVFNRWLFKAVR